MKIIFSILILVFVLSACSSNNKKTGANTDRLQAQQDTSGFSVKRLTGMFYDTLPCADCPGIATTLYLRPNNTFITQNQYLERSVFYQTGTWQVTDSILHLTDNDGQQLYKVVNYTEIEVLDTEGKKIENTREKLVLHRNNIPFKPLHPIPVEGNFSAVNDTMKLMVCSMKKEYPATLAPTALMMAVKYKKITQPGKAVFAKVLGHFELRPSLQNNTTEDFFVIEKFVAFDPSKQCP